MPSFNPLVVMIALTGIAFSAPVQNNSGFTIRQVEHEKILKNGPAQIVKTLRKFGKPVPGELLNAAQARVNVGIAMSQNASEVAAPSDQFDSSYLSLVTVGNSQVQLDFDTGSADLWVYSSLQPASERGDHDYYTVDPSKVLDGSTWSIRYGDGSGASGTVYVDKVSFAGLTATSQAVEAATYVSDQFANDESTDGLLGLAFSSINTIQPESKSTFFDTVKSQLPEPLFAVDLKYHRAGTYDFGFIDSSKYMGDITYIEADYSQGFWGMSATGYSIGSGGTKSASISGIFDTGTSLIYVDSRIVQAYYRQVRGARYYGAAGGYAFPCSSTTPDFSIIVGGVKQTVPGRHINFAPVDENSTTCFGGIQPNTDIGLSIFGDVFLKSKYVIHEGGDTPRIGLAQQRIERAV